MTDGRPPDGEGQQANQTPPGAPGAAHYHSHSWAPPPQQKRSRARGCLTWIGGAFVLLVVIGIIAAIAGGGSDDDEPGATADGDDGKTQMEEVTISECGPPDAIGVVYVKGNAENTSSKRSDYMIEVAVETADGTQIGTGTAFAENVEPGQRAIWSALTDTPSEQWAAGVKCRVVDVERNASF